MKFISHSAFIFNLYVPSKRVFAGRSEQPTPDGQRSQLESSHLEDGQRPLESGQSTSKNVDRVRQQSVQVEKSLADMQTKADLKGPFEDVFKGLGDKVRGAKDKVAAFVAEKGALAEKTVKAVKGHLDQAQQANQDALLKVPKNLGKSAVDVVNAVKQKGAEIADDAQRIAYEHEQAQLNGQTKAELLEATFPPRVAKKEKSPERSGPRYVLDGSGKLKLNDRSTKLTDIKDFKDAQDGQVVKITRGDKTIDAYYKKSAGDYVLADGKHAPIYSGDVLAKGGMSVDAGGGVRLNVPKDEVVRITQSEPAVAGEAKKKFERNDETIREYAEGKRRVPDTTINAGPAAVIPPDVAEAQIAVEAAKDAARHEEAQALFASLDKKNDVAAIKPDPKGRPMGASSPRLKGED